MQELEEIKGVTREGKVAGGAGLRHDCCHEFNNILPGMKVQRNDSAQPPWQQRNMENWVCVPVDEWKLIL